MGNSTSTISMDTASAIKTPTCCGPVKAFSDGLAPLIPQAATAGDGPMFKSTLERNEEASTSSKAYANRKL